MILRFNGYLNKQIKSSMKAFQLLILILLTSCSFPKDSKDSFAKAKQQGLKVGIADNPPFAMYENGAASGTETALIEEFAGKEGLKVHYVYASESTLVKQLEEYKLHLIIGGFEKNTVWKDKAGLSIRYNDRNVLLVAKGENELLYRLESVLLNHKENGS